MEEGEGGRHPGAGWGASPLHPLVWGQCPEGHTAVPPWGGAWRGLLGSWRQGLSQLEWEALSMGACSQWVLPMGAQHIALAGSLGA